MLDVGKSVSRNFVLKRSTDSAAEASPDDEAKLLRSPQVIE
jgi:hypothetical protein